ncbi:fimbrial protein, partial [Scandinavium manionii]|uniref:fimbrial protein n=1 Tax=Scandinavium manionii TaxID=2926520 RepID=UPI0021661265
GTLERWNAGTLERWNAGTLERWNAGTLERWNAGTLERWNAGTQVVVDLGSVYASDLKVQGQAPTNYTPKEIKIPIQCNDISATANLTMRIEGTPSADVPDAIQSDNKDVGVIVTDEHNVPLTPNNSSRVVPFKLDDSYRSNVILYAYPVGTTGNPPQEGLFTTLAYLRVDFS